MSRNPIRYFLRILLLAAILFASLQPGAGWAATDDGSLPHAPNRLAKAPVSRPPSETGVLQGTVSSLGYCDNNPDPLENAAVSIVGTGILTETDVTTDDTGFYTATLQPNASPYTITVTAAVHDPATTSGITITAGLTTTVDINLRWQKACVSVSPPRIEATVEKGTIHETSFLLANNGAAETFFQVQESLSSTLMSAGSNFPFIAQGIASIEAPEFNYYPWLSETPISGTLKADTTRVINVTFDTVTYTLGIYTATLLVKTTDPLTQTILVPLTMTLIPTVYDVQLSNDQTQTGAPGELLTYIVTISNLGSKDDIYDLTLKRVQELEGSLSVSSVPLAAGQSTTFDVYLTVPKDADEEDYYESVVQAVSRAESDLDDPEKDTVKLLTEVVVPPTHLFLPLLSK
jgi:hypothetical protein